MRIGRKLLLSAGLSVLSLVAILLLLSAADRAFPPPLPNAGAVSAELVDADGQLLRAFALPNGIWRLKTRVADVDPQLLRMLIAYEDRRFYAHSGVDGLALMRAGMQLLANGRILSGASTLSMQVARLIEPRDGRSLFAKIRQMARAIQIERRLTKAEILDLYLTLAPYGGNLEGVRAASLSYFGKEPRRLSVAEAALLVALPQSPERRRPDRHPQSAAGARARVLSRPAVVSVLGEGEAARAAAIPLPGERLPLPSLAAHLAETARRASPNETRLETTLQKAVQQGLERTAQAAALRIGPKLSLAMIMAEAETGRILAQVGSADYFDDSRSGWIDMTRVPRSPGSTLKPFIYGLAFEEGLASQETIIEDRPADFFGYRPKNFDMSYQGDVTIREALQLSLNVPAVKLLDAVTPEQLLMRFRRAEVRPSLPPGEAPGLAIGLGGLGVTLRDLVQLYAALANRGKPVTLGDGITSRPRPSEGSLLLDPVAVWNVTDILSGVVPPAGAARRGIAYKTGTSYGYRDAWSIGYDGRYVLGVWVGRPDNAAIPGLAGYATAAPILFEAFARSGIAAVPLPRPPLGAMRLARAELAPSQRRFASIKTLSAGKGREDAPLIVFPPEGAHVDLGARRGRPDRLMVKMQGGRAPFRWLANGRPLAETTRQRSNAWQPDGAGYSKLTVIDAAGRAASVGIFVE